MFGAPKRLNAPSVGASHYARDYWWKTGDIHHYPKVPENQQEDQKLRTYGEEAASRSFNPNTASEA